MNRDRTKRIYDLHAWTGVLFGLFVYVVSLSGVFALFGAELASWEDESLRIDATGERVSAMPLFTGFASEIPEDAQIFYLSFYFPSGVRPVYAATTAFRRADDRTIVKAERHWNPITGAVLADRGHGLAHWLVDFHRNLMLERTLGRALVGLSGIFLLLLILSGLITHRKMLREAFTWRLDRSVRLKWQDSHKAIGLWGIPFHLMIAFTGAWLGMIAILLSIIAAISFGGDIGAVIAEIREPPRAAAGIAAPMSSIDVAAQSVEHRVGIAPTSLSVQHWGDTNAVYDIHYPPLQKLLSAAHVEVDAVDGTIKSIKYASRQGLTYRIPAAMTTLHYGQFGGLWVKLLYAVLGLLLCVVTATGLMMWLERRLHGNAGRCPPAFYRALSRLTAGACTGLPLASIAIFHADRLMSAQPDDRIALIGTVYFTVWALAILYALCRCNAYRTCKDVLAATGIVSLVLPVTNVVATGQTVFELFRDGHAYAAGTDVAALVVGTLLLLVSGLIPTHRPTGRASTPQGKAA